MPGHMFMFIWPRMPNNHQPSQKATAGIEQDSELALGWPLSQTYFSFFKILLTKAKGLTQHEDLSLHSQTHVKRQAYL